MQGLGWTSQGLKDASPANISATEKVKELSFWELLKIVVNHYLDHLKQEILSQRYNCYCSSLKDHPLFDACEKCASETRSSLGGKKQKKETLATS